MKHILLASALLLTMAMGATCPEDGNNAYFTGNTRTSTSGHLLYEYRCATFGHVFWARP